MARPIDPTVVYPALLEAFRTDPGNIHHAAKAAGVTWRTADKFWRKGSKLHGFPPIESTVRGEMERARALIEAERLAKIEARKKELADSAEQAVQARKQEGQMTTLVRQQSLAALTSVSVFAKESRKLAEAIQDQVELERRKLAEWTAYEAAVVAGDPNAVEPAWVGKAGRLHPLDYLLGILHDCARYMERIGACARNSMEMERLHLGEPLATIRHEINEVPQEMTVQEVRIRRDNALRVIERLEQTGGLKLVAGSKTPVPTIGQVVRLK